MGVNMSSLLPPPPPPPPPPPLVKNLGVFSDFGKQANDLLTKDYYNKDMDKNFFTLRTRSNAGVDLTLTTVVKKKNTTSSNDIDHGFSVGDLTASYKNKNSFVHLKINARGEEEEEEHVSTTTQVQFGVPDLVNLSMSMKYPDLRKGADIKIGSGWFVAPSLNFTLAVSNSDVDQVLGYPEGSVTIGTPNLAIGGDFVFDSKDNTSICEFDCRYGIRYTNSIFDASLVVANFEKVVKLSCVHHLDLMNNSCVVAEFMSRYLHEDTITVGTSFQVDHPWKEKRRTVVKAKIDNHGKIGVVLHQQLIKDKMLKICSEFDTMALNNTLPKIWLSIES